MDFFNSQDKARRNTKLLVFYFVLAVLSLLLAVNAAVLLILFGRLIQAAVSRQREALADAAAVQFTRNPDGLAGALKKILIQGSRIGSPHAEEASHLFFANGLDTSIFATHPLLTDRIRALRPSLDGKTARVIQQPTPNISRPLEAPQLSHSPQIPVLLPVQGEEKRFAAPFIAERAVVANIGQATKQHLRYAMNFHQAIPPGLQVASRDPFGSAALVCALLLASKPSTRQEQLEDLDSATSDAIREEIMRIWPEIQDLPPQARIPLVDLALPALRRLSPQQFEQLRATTDIRRKQRRN